MATEIRFAFALNGGVSLAIWIGGVVDEVLRFVDAGKRAARASTTTPTRTSRCAKSSTSCPRSTSSPDRAPAVSTPRSSARPSSTAAPTCIRSSSCGSTTARSTSCLRAADRRFPHLAAERRRELPAAHRGGLRAPREERHRLRRRRPPCHRPAHGDVARRPDHQDQRRPWRPLLRRPPCRVHLHGTSTSTSRPNDQRGAAPRSGVPLDRVVPGRVRAEHRSRRPVRAPPRRRALRRRHRPRRSR